MNCPYCQQDTDGRHEPNCPNNTEYNYRLKTMQPYVCPICNGNGIVNKGFYNQTSGYWTSDTSNFEKCLTCKGTGIIWDKV